MHLSAVNEDLKIGMEVPEGFLLGKIGDSGSPGSVHLHYEIRVNGELLNPALGEDHLIDPTGFIVGISGGEIEPAIIQSTNQLYPIIPSAKELNPNFKLR